MMVKTVALVSLSSGIIGELFVRHEFDLGINRLKAYGLQVKFMKHALCGLDYLKAHPEARAEDLIQAFQDPEVEMILCATGGDDTYRLLPYLFAHDELKNAVSDKIFLGFSDTTINHLMLHKVGLNTFYGQAFLTDLCELDQNMLPYTKACFEELIQTGKIQEIRPSKVWYEKRTSYGADQIGTARTRHDNPGYELLQGNPVFSGEILGGCIDTIYDIFNTDRYSDTVSLCRKHQLFPTLENWKGKILLLESSEEKPLPEKYRKMLMELKKYGIFDVAAGVLVGKPMDEVYADAYKKLLVEVACRPDLPILWNVNVGHATPRCIIPFGKTAIVDANEQVISFK